MGYKPKIPFVNLGLVDFTLPNGQQIKVPQAFFRRLEYEAAQARRNILPRQQLFKDMRGSTARANDVQKDKPFVTYTGLNEAVDKFSQKYAGEGRANVNQALIDQQRLSDEIQQQTSLKQNTGTLRQIKVNPYGNTLSDTGAYIHPSQLQKFEPQIQRTERKLQEEVRKDLREFEKVGQQSVVSNLPVKVVRSEDPNIRSSMAKHLKNLSTI